MQKKTAIRFAIGSAIAVLLVSAALTTRLFFATAQGPRILYGETVTGDISSAGDGESWTFDGVRGDIILVKAERTDDTLAPVVTLTNPDNVLVVELTAQNADASITQFTVGLQHSGTHTITVSGANNTTGAYALSLTLQEAGQPAEGDNNILVYGRTASSAISDTIYREFWSFRGVRGDVIDVSMIATSGDLDAYVSLISPEGNVVAVSDDDAGAQDAGLYSIRLESSGTYTIAARRTGVNFGEGGTTQGNYDLTVSLREAGQLDTAITPVVLTQGRITRGRLTADAPTAFFSVEAQGVLALSLDITDPSQVGTLSVMTAERALLHTVSGPSPLLSSVTVPGAGTYWIEVTALDVRNESPVDFGLTATPLTIAQRASRPLHYDQVQTITAGTILPEAWYFYGKSGDLVTLTLAPFGPVLEGSVVIYNPDGEVVIERLIRDALEQPLLLTTTGHYEIVFAPSLVSTGYEIGLEQTGLAGLAFEQHAEPVQLQTLFATPGTPESGTVDPFKTDAWSVDVTHPEPWAFTLTATNTNLPLVLALEAPDGSVIARSVTDQITRAARINAMLPAAGRYQLQVSDLNGSDPIAYTLAGEPSEGGIMASRIVYDGVITTTANYDTWAIHAAPEELISVRVDVQNASDALPDVYLIGPDGAVITSTRYVESDSQSATLSAYVTLGGRQTILVRRPPQSARLVYHIVADVRQTLDDIDIIESTPPFSTLEALESVPVPSPLTVQLADIVAPLLPAESPVLQDARRVEEGAAIRGEIDSFTRYQAWEFTAAAGEMLEFSVIALEDTSGPDLAILDADNAIVAEKFVSGTSANYLTHRFDASGTYMLLIKLDNGGRYTLWLDTLNRINERVPDVIPGRALGYGDTLHDQLTGDIFTRSFMFFGQEGDVITASTIPVSERQTLALELSTVNAGVIANTSAPDSTQPAVLQVTLAETGLYQLDVTRATAGDDPVTFATHLTLESTSDTANTTGGVLGTAHTAFLSAAGVTHRWLVSAQAGERLTIDVSASSTVGAAGLLVQLADSRGTVFEQRQAHLGQDRVTLDDILLPRSGVYQVLVSSTQGSGLYHITVARDATSVQDIERPIQYGQSTGKVLAGENFLDVWTFAGSQGDTIAIAARPVRGDDALLSLQLRSDTGQVLATVASEQVNGTARVNAVTLPTTGHYSIAVGNLSPDYNSQTAYDLTLLLRGTSARATGRTLAYGDTASSTFFIDDPVDTWVFEGQQNDIIVARVADSEPGPNVTLTLLSTDWHAASSSGQQQILATAEPDENGITAIEFALPTSGTYTLTVRDTALHGGPYILELANKNPVVGPAQTLRLNQTREGQISDEHVINSWQFDGQAGMPINVSVIPDSRGDLSPLVRLFGPDGQVVAQASAPSHGEAQITNYVLPYQGAYTVSVTRTLEAAGHTSGGYLIALAQNAAAAPLPPVLTYGAIQSGTLDAATPSVRWTVSGQQGDTLRIHLERTSGNLDPVLRAYDLSGSLIAELHDAPNGDVELFLPVATNGDFIIEAARYHGAWGTTSGNFALVVERAYQSSGETAEPNLAYGDRVEGITDSDTRSSMWSFRGQTGDTISASISFLADDAPLTLSLRDASGNILSGGQRTQNTVTIDSYSLPANAIYTLEIRRPGDAVERFSPYTLTLDLVGIAAPTVSTSGTLLQPNTAITGQFAAPGATHTWFFNAHATDTFSLAVLPLYGALDIDLSLIGPNGTPLFTRVLNSPQVTYETGQLFLPTDGLYVVLVRNRGNSPDSAYRLMLQSVQQPTTDAIALGADHTGTLNDVRPFERWHFEAAAQTVISVRAKRTTGDLQPSLALIDANDHLLYTGHTDQDGHAAITAVAIPADGDYTIVVGRKQNLNGITAGSYKLMVREQAISIHAAEAQIIDVDRVVTGYIDGPAPQLYSFDAEVGDVFAVSAQIQDSEHDPLTLTLETETGRTVHVPTVVSGRETYIEAFTAPSAGRYVIAIEGKQPSAYTLVVTQHRSAPQDNSVTRAFGFGQTLIEVISSSDTTSHWFFSGKQSDVVTITVNTAGSNLRADAVLYGPSGMVAHGTENPDADPPGETIIGPLRFPEDGDYVLTVGAWLGAAGNTSGRFTVRMDRMPQTVSGSAGGMIPLYGSRVTGGLIPDDPGDEWTFKGIAGDMVTVRAIYASTNSTVTLTLLDPEGAAIGTSLLATGYQGAEIRDIALLENGTYTVQVDAQFDNGDPVEYELAVLNAPNSLLAASIAQAQGIAYGETLTGTAQADQLYSAWVFYGNAGDRIRSAITSGEAFTPTLFLLAPSGNILQSADTMIDRATLGTSGFYALVVENSNSVQAEYTIALEQLESSAGFRGELVDDAEGTLTGETPVHTWSLHVDYPGDYAVIVQPQTLHQIPLVTINATANTPLAESAISDARAAVASAYLTPGTTYSVEISAGLGVPDTSYSVHVLPARVLGGTAELAFEQPQVGRIDAAHLTDEWQLSTQAATIAAITVERTSKSLQPMLSVFDDNGVLLAEVEAGEDGGLSLDVDLEADSDYRVVISRAGLANGTTAGDYTIEVHAK